MVRTFKATLVPDLEDIFSFRHERESEAFDEIVYQDRDRRGRVVEEVSFDFDSTGEVTSGDLNARDRERVESEDINLVHVFDPERDREIRDLDPVVHDPDLRDKTIRALMREDVSRDSRFTSDEVDLSGFMIASEERVLAHPFNDLREDRDIKLINRSGAVVDERIDETGVRVDEIDRGESFKPLE